MPRDYAKKRPASPPARSPARRPAPARRAAAPKSGNNGNKLRWLLILGLLAGLAGFAYWLKQQPARTPAQTPTQPAATASKPKPAVPKTQKTPADRPDFTFYDMLPESKVVAPKRVDAYTPPEDTSNTRWILQTGSFRTEQQAETQKAQIAMLGLRTQITKIETDKHDIWYRVETETFTSRSKMNAAFDKLTSVNIKPITRKVP